MKSLISFTVIFLKHWQYLGYIRLYWENEEKQKKSFYKDENVA